jgi:hypothetical protein
MLNRIFYTVVASIDEVILTFRIVTNKKYLLFSIIKSYVRVHFIEYARRINLNNRLKGATTFHIATPSITKFSITTLSITKFSIMIYGAYM